MSDESSDRTTREVETGPVLQRRGAIAQPAIAPRHPVLRVARFGYRIVRRIGRVGLQGLRLAGGAILGRRPQPTKVLRATAEQEREMRERLAGVLTASERTGGPVVSIVIPTRNGLGHLQRLLPALERLAYRDLELVVVDNASTDGTLAYLEGLDARFPVRLVRNQENASFSVANNQGVAASSGELLLLLNNDIEPAGVHVLGHMVDRLLSDASTAAVGARLIYPRRDGPRRGPLHSHVDLSLQHRGIDFRMDAGRLVARNLGGGEDPLGPAASTATTVPGVTAACLLVRRTSYDAVGGFETGYNYGAEDVDLCVRLRSQGQVTWYEPQATWWHHESATQAAEHGPARAARQLANWRHFHDLWGPRLYREVFLDRLANGRRWSTTALHVGITLTRDDASAGWGDYYTARELGTALEGLGWRISYLERWQDHWYRPDPTIDVIISLLDAFDVRRIPAGIVTVAWVRNWTDRWLGHDWFDDYDLVLASSSRSKELIDQRSVHVARLLPLATNPDRFGHGNRQADRVVDVTTTTNRWGQARGVEHLLPRLRDAGRAVSVYGRGWDAVPEMAGIARGSAAYDDLPDVYASTTIVLDDTAGPTMPYGAVNSRVFDALASGALVVTDNVAGADELFDGLLPAAEGEDERLALVARWLDDPGGRAELQRRLTDLTLERHTYARRAREIQAMLGDWAGARHVEIAIEPRSWPKAPQWGDYHFGRAFQGALHRQGMVARLRLRDDWEAWGAERADVAVQVFGITPRRPRSGQVNALWVVSHPEKVDDALVGPQDVVFAASDGFAERLRARGVPAIPLHQATDTRRMQPRAGGPRHRLLFIANSRGVRRTVVAELDSAGYDLSVYGTGYPKGSLRRGVHRGEHVRNEDLASYYGAADIVLNDTWPDMAAEGFISNRLYDVAAAGGFAISDAIPGIEEEFDGGIPVFGSGEELRALVDHYLGRPEERAALAARARTAVHARHSFDHRAATFLAAVQPLLDRRPPRL